jgi:SAM-dependent methyltransferase
MDEFWESSFKNKQTMWGFAPADSAILALDLFRQNGIKKILIPGFGYGRNAKPFIENGLNVTGIEISKTAIELSKQHYGDDIKVYHGSVGDMPFNNEMYDGIYCYALIHLLNFRERAKLLKDCYNQLNEGGYMVFIACSDEYPTYGQGKKLSKNRYESFPGVKVFFYDSDAVVKEFGKYGLIDFRKIDEPIKFMENHPPLNFWYIVCKK